MARKQEGQPSPALGDARTEPPSGPSEFFRTAPSIGVPKGGGAIRGIDEKFSVNAATGTGSYAIPLPLSPGRSGFQPSLAVSYDSGSGNGPFGLGWSLAVPAITRKTDKGLPRYRDAEESDVFVLSEAEDLVPCLDEVTGERIVALGSEGSRAYTIHRYRPRIEGLFARIERWQETGQVTFHWRITTRDNVTSIYGRDRANACIADPEDHRRIFKWLVEETRDDKGNVIRYEYKREDTWDQDGRIAGRLEERTRRDAPGQSNLYLKRVLYGNRRPFEAANWLFEAVFDYGEHSPLAPTPTESEVWPSRRDPFSHFRAGFEVRTYRLCQRVLIFHHFDFAPPEPRPYLVRSVDFAYDHAPGDRDDIGTDVCTFLRSVTQTGYRWEDTRYVAASLPRLDFFYTGTQIDHTVKDLPGESLDNVPGGAAGPGYQWVDLYGEGLAGVLAEQGEGWYYKANRGERGLAPIQCVAEKPAVVGLGGGPWQVMDLAGDGRSCVVQHEGATPGFYAVTEDDRWQPHVPFKTLPTISLQDANLRWLDIDGDGRADILITADDELIWYPSLGLDGFGPAETVAKPEDEERGPRLLFADGAQTLFLADMSGDGLTDIARIRNSEVCYWPNLGYGRFGRKIVMRDAPVFDTPEDFDPRRIRLGDIDGFGTTDILYIGREGVRFWMNRSGNAWSEAQDVSAYPVADNLSQISVTDLLGLGTACLVWSSPLPSADGHSIQYVDLMSGRKPHLLERVANNLGAERIVRYVSSTRFYLEDLRQGSPWATKLPFPVQVVERVEARDYIGRNRFVTRYSYHHGYYDHEEREFRGFGSVEQWDTEEMGALAPDDWSFPDAEAEPVPQAPPVLVRSWFHTGAFLDRERLENRYAREYYREPGLGDPEALLLPDTVLPTDLSVDEQREACRALKGSMLRQEVYAEDDTPQARHPYTVSEQNYEVRRVQAKGANRHAVFLTHAREAVSFHYERKLVERVPGEEVADPRVTHEMTLEVDAFGNVVRSASLAYGRRSPETDAVLNREDREKQARAQATFTENAYTSLCDDDRTYRLPNLWETKTFELVNPPSPTALATSPRLSTFLEMQAAVEEAKAARREIPYEDWEHAVPSTAGSHRRLIEHVRTLFCDDPLQAALPYGEMGRLGLPYEAYKLAFTPGVLGKAFVERGLGVTGADLRAILAAEDSGYLEGDTYRDAAVRLFPTADETERWWIRSGRLEYPTAPLTKFCLPSGSLDSFGKRTGLEYDDPNYLLFVARVEDPVGNVVTADYDYRVLQPARTVDPNDNITAVAFDALGLVVGTALMGKAGDWSGDTLEGFKADLSPDADLAAFHREPRGHKSIELLAQATTRAVYDVLRYQLAIEDGLRPEEAPPPYAATLARETHVGDPPNTGTTKIQISFSYSDGNGREIQKKIQAEKGKVRPHGPDVDPRWVGSGWTVLNNKGKPVRQYEPFFSDTHEFEFAKEVGVSSVLLYDPVQRVVATLHPNGTYEKVLFDPWRQETWDVNDTVTLDPRSDTDVSAFVAGLPFENGWLTWYDRRADGNYRDATGDDAVGRTERNAAFQAAQHANTPTRAYSDALGRAVLVVADNGDSGLYPTRTVLDVEGNARRIVDARGNLVMESEFDLLSHPLKQISMDAGTHRLLGNGAGKPLLNWDSNDHRLHHTYDDAQRPLALYVRSGTKPEVLVERTVYGERHPNAQRLNLGGRPWMQLDGAGVVIHSGTSQRPGHPSRGQEEAYDFKGNSLRSRRRLTRHSAARPEWQSVEPSLTAPPGQPLDLVAIEASLSPLLEPETFMGATLYDGLSRPIQLLAPRTDRVMRSRTGAPLGMVNVTQHTYNDANLLETVDVWVGLDDEPPGLLDRAGATYAVVSGVDYDAKGQRLSIVRGNGVTTTYDYDEQTFRLRTLVSAKPGQTFQDLRYTSDAAGNVTALRDRAQPTIYFDGSVVTPDAYYLYDALYRLVRAHGREHVGQLSAPRPEYDDFGRVGLAHPQDGQAMRRYVEDYEYDAVGNILRMSHKRGPVPFDLHSLLAGGEEVPPLEILESSGETIWNRFYQYLPNSNRLLSTSDPGEARAASDYGAVPAYGQKYGIDSSGAFRGTDPSGNITSMPHLRFGVPNLAWDFKDQLVQLDLPDGATAHYLYEAGGQRARKIIVGATGTRGKERTYLSGFEVYREFDGTGDGVELEREALQVMDGEQRVALIETKVIESGFAVTSRASLPRYEFANHLGSACLVLDDQAARISYEEYFPYGSTSYQAVSTGGELPPKRYRYSGKERDDESGFYYHGARYYAPWTGRWLSCDPADGPNLFAYCRNNPCSLVDPNGMQEGPPIGASRPIPALDSDEVPGSDRSSGGGAGSVSQPSAAVTSPQTVEAPSVPMAQEGDISYTTDPEMADVINELTGNTLPQAIVLGSDVTLPVGAPGGMIVIQDVWDVSIPDMKVIGGEQLFAVAQLWLILPEQRSLDKDGNEQVVPAQIRNLGTAYRPMSAKDSRMLAADLLTVVSVVEGGAALGTGLKAASTEAEIARFMEQGFARSQANYLAQRYVGMGEHFVPRRWGLPDAITESRLNVLRPRGISRGRFYELHYGVDTKFFGTRFPRAVGGGVWSGARVGVRRLHGLEKLWSGTTQELKVTTGAVGALAGGSAHVAGDR